MSGVARKFIGRGPGRALRSLLPLLPAAALAACAIHPLQQDVTGLPTKAIVDRIRCEARLAVLDKAIARLSGAADEARTRNPALAARFDAVAAEVEGKRRSGKPVKFDPRRLPTATAKAFYSRYFNTVIAYDFLMQGIENNKAGFTADPVRLITNGVAGVTLGASGDFTRDNQRHFSFADTFGELLDTKEMEWCVDYPPENFVYPVSGRVGLREVVDTFIELNEDKPLEQLAAGDKTSFADTLKFTTTWLGSATPHVQIDPVGTQWGLASGTNIGLSASRQDIHTLTVGLAMGPPQYVPLSGVPFVFRASPGANMVQQSNKAAAFQAIQDLRLRSFLDRGVLIAR
jgi:hypothetical protein